MYKNIDHDLLLSMRIAEGYKLLSLLPKQIDYAVVSDFALNRNLLRRIHNVTKLYSSLH